MFDEIKKIRTHNHQGGRKREKRKSRVIINIKEDSQKEMMKL